MTKQFEKPDIIFQFSYQLSVIIDNKFVIIFIFTSGSLVSYFNKIKKKIVKSETKYDELSDKNKKKIKNEKKF